MSHTFLTGLFAEVNDDVFDANYAAGIEPMCNFGDFTAKDDRITGGI